ncbi:MAG: DNA polymerase II [Candidatus Altiarchaeales archaeon ex4484_2]|nr:MAG: DNA polymerase II [Candidatus Altiarchaeales archaeon ex4484_2]
MKDIEDIIKKFEDEGIILTSRALGKIRDNSMKPDVVIEKARERNVWLISDEFIVEFIEQKKKKDKPVKKTKKIPAKERDSELKINEDFDVTGKSTCEGRIEDFLGYFNHKYENIKSVLKERPSMRSAVPIKFLRKQGNDINLQFIGMVSDKRESRRGFKFLDLEDPTGEIRVLVSKDSRELNELFDNILLDEVIGVEGRIYNDLFIAKSIYQPDLPINHKTNSAPDDVCAAMISDIHVGSYLFLEKEFKSFIDCLKPNGNRKNGDIFGKIKYLVVAGDLVDGVGIYPNQEKELAIPDIYKQYDFLASLLEEVPDHIEIVLCMGNHDAVRLSEPQTKLDKDIGAPLYDLPNVHMCGNPSMISMHGVKTLIYHGTSLDGIIGNLSRCTYSRPEVAMVEYLKRRYLVPSYGRDNIAPEGKDYLFINEIPDIFHCGHVHTNGYMNYRGVRVINSGTFQARTKYQEEQGHVPTPGRVPIINLQNHEVSMVHFYDEG